MNFMFITVFIIGLIMGIVIGLIWKIVQVKNAKELANELFHESEEQRRASIESVIKNVENSFGKLSLEALSKSTDELIKLAEQKLGNETKMNNIELTNKKELIDQELIKINSELEGVSKLMADLEKDRVNKYGELSTQLKTANEQTKDLAKITNAIREAMANTKVRGQWGERMAEDILQVAGFIEKINYLKQKTIEENKKRPDFTFLLPKDFKLNMDVKFPLDNYIKYLETESDTDKEKYRKEFIKDVKVKIKEVTTREYINPEQNTIDYVILFIPNEQIYTFIHEQDKIILDEALKNKVIVCSPITLFAVLAIIRQAMDNFALEKASNEILMLLSQFKKQWSKFVEQLEKCGERINAAQKEYEILISTRYNQLEKPLNKIESLRTQHNLLLTPDNEPEIIQDNTNNT